MPTGEDSAAAANSGKEEEEEEEGRRGGWRRGEEEGDDGKWRRGSRRRGCEREREREVWERRETSGGEDKGHALAHNLIREVGLPARLRLI